MNTERLAEDGTTEGTTEGATVQDPPDSHDLEWLCESAGESAGESDGEYAVSARHVDAGATSAHYWLYPGELAAGENGERLWELELVQLNDDTVVGGLDLGSHHSAEDAKQYAQTWERRGRTPDR